MVSSFNCLDKFNAWEGGCKIPHVLIKTVPHGIWVVQADSKAHSEKVTSAPSSVQESIQTLEEQIISLSAKLMWKISKGFQNGYLLQASKYTSGIELRKRKEQAHKKAKVQKNANECSTFNLSVQVRYKQLKKKQDISSIAHGTGKQEWRSCKETPKNLIQNHQTVK